MYPFCIIVMGISYHTVKKLLDFESSAQKCANCSIKTCQVSALAYVIACCVLVMLGDCGAV